MGSIPTNSGSNNSYFADNNQASSAAQDQLNAQRATGGLQNDLNKIKANDINITQFQKGTSPDLTIPQIFQSAELDSVGSTSFFQPFEIDPLRWNQFFPYRLLVVDATTNSIITFNSRTDAKLTATAKEGQFNISFIQLGNSWEFRLPISPSQLSISTQYAIEVNPTLRGINEEHGGTRFKMINFAGTMGVWPFRPTIADAPADPNILSTLFAGTIQAFDTLKTQVNSTINILTSNHPANKPTVKSPGMTPPGYQGTGYYHALFLEQFLEQYSEAKKNPACKNWRLVLDIPKQNRSFVVTPVAFDWIQGEDKPNEVRYRLQLKAWKRIKLSDQATAVQLSINPLTPDLLTRLINAVDSARLAVGDAYSLIAAVRSDVQTPFNLLRQISLFAKDLAGLPAAIIDLPRQIIQDSSSAIQDVIKNLDAASLQLGKGTSEAFQNSILNTQAAASNQENLTAAAVAAGTIGAAAIAALQTNATNAIFANPEQNYQLLSQINQDQVIFNAAQQQAIQNDLFAVQQLTVSNLITIRGQLLTLAIQLSNSFGAGNAVYNKIYGLPPPTYRVEPMTIDEQALLKSIYDVIQSMDMITATDDLDDARIETAMEYVGGLAHNSGITFDDDAAKISVPVPYGLTIQQIADRYLQDSDRWIEIATLNALRSPYIDENGFSYPLLSNASGRQLNIADVTNLFVNQKVTLYSNTQIPVTRQITNIENISQGNYLITLNGLANLDNFTLADQAYLKAYLPATVNSKNTIFVPTTQTPTDTVFSRPVPATVGDPLVGMSRVDMLLDTNNDIAMNSFGEIAISFGLSNCMQALKLKFTSPPGRNLKHKDFGAGLRAGDSNADTKAQDLYNAISSAVLADPRFSSIQRLDINQNGPTTTVSLVVNLNNGKGVLPISFQLNG